MPRYKIRTLIKQITVYTGNHFEHLDLGPKEEFICSKEELKNIKNKIFNFMTKDSTSNKKKASNLKPKAKEKEKPKNKKIEEIEMPINYYENEWDFLFDANETNDIINNELNIS